MHLGKDFLGKDFLEKDFLAGTSQRLIGYLRTTNDTCQLQKQKCDTSNIGRRIPQSPSLGYLVLFGQPMKELY